MKRAMAGSLLGIALLALSTAAAGAETVTVNSILIAHRAGATADGIIAVVGNPANVIAMTAADVATLRDAGVPGSVIIAIEARVAAPVAPRRGSLQPDDPRLVDLVRLSTSGIAESIITEQIRQSNPAFELSVADLLYLKENGVLESIIASLMATRPAGQAPAGAVGTAPAVPQEVAFDDLVLVRGFLKKSRPGRLVMSGDTLAWVDAGDPEENFEFQITGLEKVWFTCQARTPENFCHEINFQVVKGPEYRFRDLNQESGENVAVLRVMDALRKYFPQAAFGPPHV
jgi:hypothetical protein